MKNINDISTYPSDYNWLSEEQQDKIVTILNARQKIADEYWTLCKDIYENEECLDTDDYKTIFTISADKETNEKLRIYNNLINFLSGMKIAYASIGIMVEYNWPDHKGEWFLATQEDAINYENAPEEPADQPVIQNILLSYGDIGI